MFLLSGGAWWSGSGRSNLGNYQPYARVPNGGWYGPYGYGGYGGGYGEGNPPGYVPSSYAWNGPGYGNMAPPTNPRWHGPAFAGYYNNSGPRFVGPAPQQGTVYQQPMRNSPWGPGLYNYGYPGPYGYWWNAGLGFDNYAWNGTGWRTPTGYAWNGPYQGGGYVGSSYYGGPYEQGGSEGGLPEGASALNEAGQSGQSNTDQGS